MPYFKWVEPYRPRLLTRRSGPAIAPRLNLSPSEVAVRSNDADRRRRGVSGCQSAGSQGSRSGRAVCSRMPEADDRARGREARSSHLSRGQELTRLQGRSLSGRGQLAVVISQLQELVDAPAPVFLPLPAPRDRVKALAIAGIPTEPS